MKNKDVALLASKVLDDKKAENIICLDISEKSSFADYFVIASGGSERQANALAEEVKEKLEKEEIIPKRIEGTAASGWILMDFGDIIVNIFTVEMRLKYSIEKIWADCKNINVDMEV